MEENVVSEDDRFESMRNREVYYMPISQTQRPPVTEGDGNGGGVHVVKCKSLIALNFPSANWTASDVSFGAAQPTTFARDNVSLLLKVVQWAIQARLNCYIETLYDGVLAAATGKLKERGKRIFLPIPETRFVRPMRTACFEDSFIRESNQLGSVVDINFPVVGTTNSRQWSWRRCNHGKKRQRAKNGNGQRVHPRHPHRNLGKTQPCLPHTSPTLESLRTKSFCRS